MSTPKKPSDPKRGRTRSKRPAPMPTSVPAGAPEVVVTVAAPAAPPEPAPTDVELAILALYAEDAFQAARRAPGADLARVAPDPRLAPKWTVVGTLTGTDALMRLGRHKIGARKVFYGWRLQIQGGHTVLAIRGTGTKLEWLIDCAFAPRAAHPVAGRVESGFWDVFTSLRLDGKPLTSIAAGEPITVVGHSLGAALATYAALELARAGAKVRGVFVASPHPGDAEFCKAFGAAVPDHVMYRNVADLVPRVPFWFGYSSVPNVVTLSAAGIGFKITGGPAGQHHVLSYVALQNLAALRAFDPLPCDARFLDCIHLDPAGP
jgi:triacylglycerol lipase